MKVKYIGNTICGTFVGRETLICDKEYEIIDDFSETAGCVVVLDENNQQHAVDVVKFDFIKKRVSNDV